MKNTQYIKKRILTGDRATGKLHIGHLAGSLLNRVKLQDTYDQYIIVANIQGLTDNSSHPEKVRNSVFEMLKDYYATGIDFTKSTVFIQSEVPEIHEIFIYLANFATIQQISHNPTIKTEIQQKHFGSSTPLGFFIYPIHQIADIVSVGGDLVPVGPGEVPQIEGAREVVKKFNTTYGVNFLKEPEALVGVPQNVPGIDGNAKMGKSLHNCIYIGDSEEELKAKVFSMKTDPNRIHTTDPGKIEGNVVFTYHDIFNSNTDEVKDLKERYKKGTVSDTEVKDRLFYALNTLLLPMRERRDEADRNQKELLSIVQENNKKVRFIARGIADQMKAAIKITYF